jgi:hypothetical protein
MRKRPGPKPRIDDGDWVPAFLANLRSTCNVRAACEAASINRPGVYKYRDAHPDFAAQWEEAIEDAVQLLEFSARKRALEGDTTLTIFLLKAHRREIYQDRIALELTVQQLAEKIAAAQGLDPKELVRVAERIASGEA